MKTIDDVMICPQCGSDETFEHDVDELEFSYNGTGHYIVICYCKQCQECFNLHMNFKYEVTDSWTR